MKKEWFSEHNAILLFLFLFIIISCLVLRSPLSFEGGDNFVHYKFAHYAWQYPALFMDHWGKPMYTILSSPFAQFGFKGAKFFNVVMGMTAAWLTYLTALKLGFRQAWLALIFMCFAPIYFLMFNTALTEVLFSTMIIFCVYCFFRNKFFLAAFVISFIPLVRSEGYLFILFFLWAFLAARKLRYIPLLSFGFIFFSILGYFYPYHDLLWIITRNPYNENAVAYYGTGEFLYFFKKSPYISGTATSILIGIGLISLLRKQAKKKSFLIFLTDIKNILIVYTAVSYFMIHTLIWWLGKFLSSVGEIRVMAAIMPLFSLIALEGWNEISHNWKSQKKLNFFLTGCLVILVVKSAVNVYDWGYKTSETEKVVIKTSDWLLNSPYIKNKIYYYNPFFFISLNINPYDSARMQAYVPDNKNPEKGIKPGDLVLWDAHLAPNEGQLPLDRLLKNNHFRLLNLFQPQHPFKVLGGYNYEIYIFQRVSEYILNPGTKLMKSFDFEPSVTFFDSLITDEKAHSGKFSFKLTHDRLYSPAFTPTVGELRKAGIKKITASGYLYPVFNPNQNITALIISFERDTSINFNNVELNKTTFKMNQWNFISLSCPIPEEANDSDVMKVFFYQPGNKFIYLDDFKIEVLKIITGN